MSCIVCCIPIFYLATPLSIANMFDRRVLPSHRFETQRYKATSWCDLLGVVPISTPITRPTPYYSIITIATTYLQVITTSPLESEYVAPDKSTRHSWRN
ncbi:hypothetical protein P153DRAFT_222269 [Dothidotthia symphoricarpi CBS 119687]|uniref:Uncharacterized protein n=1 Tax=Dothidotthia symphoricarpi CBS 119687 TaxID=1392245 RepID=A0A6A6AFT0_9PLEO|nr:uncharacterized protein P153DRAFT_222269 [Dothidotthia symphoricarpi CBS 119687]KAF2130640.1 hypothetical protein P153DRAFT_222269 [Dothidotthia symphoricarpi CBS 119687]